MRRLLKWIFLLVGGAIGAVFAILLLRAFDARNQPPLKPWHEPLETEARAEDLPDSATLADYLRIEDAAFREMNEKVIPKTPPADRLPANRYWADSPVNPDSRGTGTGPSSSPRRASFAAARCSSTASPTPRTASRPTRKSCRDSATTPSFSACPATEPCRGT